VYEYLEPLYADFRKLAVKNRDGTFGLIHMDECVEQLLNEKEFANLVLPPIVKRYKLEEAGVLQPRVSPLQAELDELARAAESSGSEEKKKKKKKKKEKKEKKRQLVEVQE